MRTYPGSLHQRMFAVTVPTIAVLWLVAVPEVLSTSSFVALGTLMVAVLWVGQSAYGNGQARASVARSLSDTDRRSSLPHPRDGR